VRLACADGMSERGEPRMRRGWRIARDTVDTTMTVSVPPGWHDTSRGDTSEWLRCTDVESVVGLGLSLG